MRRKIEDEELFLHLRAHRQAAGLKLAYVARKLHVTAHTVSKWERSETGPPMKYLPLMAKEYGCAVEDLFHPPRRYVDDEV